MGEFEFLVGEGQLCAEDLADRQLSLKLPRGMTFLIQRLLELLVGSRQVLLIPWIVPLASRSTASCQSSPQIPATIASEIASPRAATAGWRRAHFQPWPMAPPGEP